MKFGTTALHYIDYVCEHINSETQRYEFRDELSDHLAEKVSFLMEAKGLSQEDAEQEAIVYMGNMESVSSQMNRIHTVPSAKLMTILRTVFVTLATTFGFWNFIMYAGYGGGLEAFLMESSPNLRTNGPWGYDSISLDTRLFFWIPFIVTVLLFLVPSIQRKIHQHRQKISRVKKELA